MYMSIEIVHYIISVSYNNTAQMKSLELQTSKVRRLSGCHSISQSLRHKKNMTLLAIHLLKDRSSAELRFHMYIVYWEYLHEGTEQRGLLHEAGQTW